MAAFSSENFMSVSWRSSSLSTRLLERAYVLFLAFVIAVSGWSLVFLNQDLLATGRFKFPFPFAATYLQLLVAYPILFCARIIVRLGWFLLKFLHTLPRYQRIPSNSSGSSLEHEENGSGLELRPLNSVNSTTNGFFPALHEKTKRYAPLTALLIGKILFMNCSLAYSHYHNYELAEIMSVPVLLFFTSNFDSELAVSYISSSLIAAGDILLANVKPNVRLPWESVVCAVLSCICGAAFYHVLYHTWLAGRSQNQHIDDSTGLTARTHYESWIENISSSFDLLHHIMLLSVLMLTPVFLGSGEALGVWRDYLYVTDRTFLLLIVATGSLTCAALCGALLLVQVAGSVATAFVVVPRTAFQLWRLGQTSGLESARLFIGVVGCLWYYSSSSKS